MDSNNILEILRSYHVIATVGFSKDPSKPSHQVPKFLIARGYKVIPVNPTVDQILGLKSYKTVTEIPEPIEIVQVFRPSKDIPQVVNDVLERVEKKEDVKVLWLQEGIRNDEAVKPLLGKLKVVQDRCMYKEYMKLIEGNQNPEPLTK
ncbi:CoA-binding protein [Sulfolobales archaeon HS-7]|nr:CoA-binding protein [Sulfolobales archaeon HS-7]